MPFPVAKIIMAFLVPPASLLIIMALGLLIVRICRGCGRCLIAIGFIGLYLASISPVSDKLLLPLESYASPLTGSRVEADAIVVLGGGAIDSAWHEQPISEAGGTSLSRLVKGILLSRRFHLPLVLMGGRGDVMQKTADADAMDAVARALGFSAKDIVVENQSRNTIEGARALNKFIKGKRIVLVTSAFHMKRASGMFRKQGFTVIPAPAAYIAANKEISWRSYIPNATALENSSSACTEYISLFWYRAIGELSFS